MHAVICGIKNDKAHKMKVRAADHEYMKYFGVVGNDIAQVGWVG